MGRHDGSALTILQKITTQKLVWFLVAVCLLLQLHLQFVQQVNWDEFFYLSRIFEFQRGELQRPLQNFHVHYFSWLTALPGDEIDKINVARVVMWCVQIGTMAMIYLMARPFVSKEAAAMAVLAYVSAGYVFIHGTSFRTDPVAAFLVTAALTILVRSKLGALMLALYAGLLALAMMVSVKVIFFAPAFIAVAIWRLLTSTAPVKLLLKLGATVIGIVVIFGALFQYQISVMTIPDLSAPTENMTAAYETTILSGKIFPRLDYMKGGIFLAPVQSLLLLFGFAAALVAVIKRRRQAGAELLLIALALPLLSFVFYRNAFPYYFAFIFPTAMVLIGYGFEKLKLSKGLEIAISIVMVASMFSVYNQRLAHNQSAQKHMLTEAHKIFPDGVNYIDRCSMIGAFSKQGFFMSSWGMQSYNMAGGSKFGQLLAESTIPFVLNNGTALAQALEQTPIPDGQDMFYFSRQDATILQTNYIQHWGPIWVAGKTFAVNNTAIYFDIVIPGTYTVEADQIVSINGTQYTSGQTVALRRGRHTTTAVRGGHLTLRWGEDLYKPITPAPERPMFEVF